MKALVFLLMFIGFVFVVIGFVKTNQTCPPPIVQYRYIPKIFNEEQNVKVPVTAIFSKMFNDTTPCQDRKINMDVVHQLVINGVNQNKNV